MSTRTTQEIADYLGVNVGTVRQKAFKLFPKKMVFDDDSKSFVFDVEQTQALIESLRNKKPLALASDGFLTLPNEIKNTVTTKELAENLGVDVKTIQRAVESLDMNVERVGSSHTMIFTESQATAIKIELQNHSKVAKNGFDTLTISNDLEGELLVQKAMAYQQRKIAQLQEQVEKLKPDANSWNTYAGNLEQRNSEKCFRDVAKMLQINPQYILTDFFIEKKFIYRDSNNRLKPTQVGIESGIIVNRAINNNNYSGEQCKVTSYGMKKLADWKEKRAFEGHLVKERTDK